jgi:MFS family permease
VAASTKDITFRYEKWRAVSTGILETAGTTFLLLIAVRHFEAGATAKALIATGGSLGLLLSPLAVSTVESLGWATTRAAARLSLAGAACCLLMAAVPWLPLFAVGSVLAMTCSAAAIPLMTQVYQENYPERERGRLFSRTIIIRIGMTALFAEVAGRALTGRLEPGQEFYRLLLAVFAFAFAFAAFCLSRVPSRPLQTAGGGHPFRALKYANGDRLFRHTLICWMLMGLGNLMMFPLRVEYLANPQYGVTLDGQLLDVGTIALLTAVIPNVARLLTSHLWGWLFDHANFFVLRGILNLGFAVGILTFFTSDSLAGLVFGAVVFGVSNGGGDVAWSLWVTKFAPPDRVADYMSVHTFFTGVRGLLAPFLGFHLVAAFGMTAAGWFSAVLIAVSALMLFSEVKFDKPRKKGEPLVEEISESGVNE